MVYLFSKIVKCKRYYYLGENKSINGQSRRISETYLGSADNLKRFLERDSYLSSQNYWNHWQYLNEERIESIQKELLPNLIKNVDLSQIFYDPTNFSTYIEDKHKDNPKNMKRHAVSMAKYGKP